MAVVLSAEDDSYFKRSSSSLRRSSSHTHFGSSPNLFAHNSASSTPTPTLEKSAPESYDVSDSSSVSSSPRTIHADSADLSYASTPGTTFSLANDEFEEAIIDDESMEDTFIHPSQYQPKLYVQPSYTSDGLLSPYEQHGPLASPEDQRSLDTTKPGTPDCSEHAEDDTAVTKQPTRHVDYLSHDWKEEDIWSSWRYVVSRRGEFEHSARLENASWRTWVKAKNNLKTISPESLNWLKDCDVTWLYGPLQIGTTKKPSQTEPSSHTISKSESLINLNKKPCLKKRSMSELMLQRSISTASLLKQATAAVRAQETRGPTRPVISRAHTDFSPFAARRPSHETAITEETSVDSSGVSSPSAGRRHIHFNEQVEQCIAVDVKGDDEDDFDADLYAQDSDSDDGFMMKKTKTKKRKPTRRRDSIRPGSDAKIIAMLPSTTLKQRSDTPEPQETAMKHSTGVVHSPISSSSSQETLRPSKESTHFFFGDDDEDDEMEEAMLNLRSDSFDHLPSKSGSSSPNEIGGMRRTESGMLMPVEEAKTAQAGEGIFGRVVDTVNTARDIAHVIWNVGWRK